MIESYVDAYAGIYGDDTDAYVEEIVADTYAGMNRTDYGTNQLHADVKMEVGQWQKKSGSARAPPVKTQYSIKKDNRGQNYVDVPIWAMQIKNASEVGKALSDIVRKQFRSWVDVAGQKIGINQRTAGEWTFSKDAQRLYSRNKTAYADKVNAFGVAGELLQASRDYIGEQAKHFRKDNFREFARGKVSFKVGANGYEADIIVGTTTKGAAILYDMVNITPKKIAEAPNTTLSAQNAEDRRQGTSARESISKTGETVKGKFSASAEQAKNDQTEMVAFKDWFGDWQNDPESASKVVNADGTPKVVYHGTNAEFNTFQQENGAYFFSESRDYAESMADERRGNRIIEAYLKMKNPYTVKLSPEQFTDNIAEAPFIRYAKEHGNDGVIFEYDGSKEDLAYDKFYVVFDSTQIKSATDNIGTFDKTNPDIRYSSQDGRYRDLMGEKAAKYTKGILCAYRKIKKSLSKTGEGFLYRCTIIPITPFKKTMRSDKDTSGTPETIRTSDPSLRRRMLYPLSYWGL